MLEELIVSDVALLKRGHLEFHPGMTVLTGETGAGKTALVSALKLVAGGRADVSAVRDGASEAVVQARFVVEGDEVVVRRRLGADGRSRCYLDDDMVTVTALAERVGPLIDLSGQHEHQSLLRPSTHVGYLDRWAGPPVSDALRAYREALESHAELAMRVKSLEDESSRLTADVELQRYLLEQIDGVDPVAGEYETLSARLPVLQNADRLAELASTALADLRSEGGALDRLARAADELARAAASDPSLERLAARVSEASVVVDDISADVRAYADSIDADPGELARVLDRLGALDGLVKRFGPRLEDVFEKRERARRALSIDGEGDRELEEARAGLHEARARLDEAAARLDAARSEAVPSFESRLAGSVAELGMAGAAFSIAVTALAPERWTPSGPSAYELLFSPGPGVAPRPLARIASGGELSRVMLAVKGVLLGDGATETLVFDEVDAGIGGSTAWAVGERLASLARSYQVVVVTHLAQVAAFADAQLVVEKCVEDGVVTTSVRSVEDDGRVAEIARMLSGRVDDAALEHARALLAEASERR